MSKKHWIYIKRGLSEDGKHRAQMGECIWLYMHIIDRADWETGIAYDWKDEQEAADMGMPVRTLREQRRKLDEADYITCRQKKYSQDIVIKRWINPRDYSSKVLNQGNIQGDALLSPSEDESYTQGYTQGSTQDVTPTLYSDSKSIIEKENQYLKIIRACARTHWGHDFGSWHKVEKVLEAATFERIDHTIIISGLGDKAGMYQDRYAKTFEHDFLGGLNEQVTVRFE